MTKLLIEGSCLTFQSSLAKIFGLNESIILQQLHYWTISCKKEKEEGRVWIYNTYSQWQKQFPFWSEVTIRRIIKSLEKQEIILVKSKTTNNMMVKYYAVNYDKISEFNLKQVNYANDQNDHDYRSKRSGGVIKLISPIYIEETKTTNKEYLSKNSEKFQENISSKKENSVSDKLVLEKNYEREMINYWNNIFQEEGREEVKLTLPRAKTLDEVFKKFFDHDLAKWQNYCQKITSSKFLMGEVTNFKASLDWCLREETIIKILEGNYKLGDRTGATSNGKRIIKLEPKSSDPLWIKVLAEFNKLHGEAVTTSWLGKLCFHRVDNHTVSLTSDSKFILQRIESNYLNQIKSISNEISGSKINQVILKYNELVNKTLASEIGKNYNKEEMIRVS